jgi:hypothetical protein
LGVVPCFSLTVDLTWIRGRAFLSRLWGRPFTLRVRAAQKRAAVAASGKGRQLGGGMWRGGECLLSPMGAAHTAVGGSYPGRGAGVFAPLALKICNSRCMRRKKGGCRGKWERITARRRYATGAVNVFFPLWAQPLPPLAVLILGGGPGFLRRLH